MLRRILPVLLLLCLSARGASSDADGCAWLIKRVGLSSLDAHLDELESEGRLQEIGMFQTVRVEAPAACRTGGLGPCLGVVIINKKTNVAYVGHFAGVDQRDVLPFIDRAVAEAASPQDLQIAMAGVSTEPDRSGIVPGTRADFQKHAEEYVAAVKKKFADVGVTDAQITERISLEPTSATYEILVDTLRKRIYLGKGRDPR